MLHQRHTQGKSVLEVLKARGIEARNVTRNRKTGIYAVKFRANNVSSFYAQGTDSAEVWAQRIQERFEDVEIVDTYDSVAEWRPQKPVIFATVFIKGDLS